MQGLELYRYHAARAAHYYGVAEQHRRDALDVLKSCESCRGEAAVVASVAGCMSAYHARAARTVRDAEFKPRRLVVIAGGRR